MLKTIRCRSCNRIIGKYDLDRDLYEYRSGKNVIQAYNPARVEITCEKCGTLNVVRSEIYAGS